MARTLRWLVLGFVIGASCRGGGAMPQAPVFLSPAQRDAAVAALQRGVAPTSGTPTSAPLMPWQIDLR